MIEDGSREPAPVGAGKTHLNHVALRRIVVEDKAAHDPLVSRDADRRALVEPAHGAKGNSACDECRHRFIIAIDQPHTATPPLS